MLVVVFSATVACGGEATHPVPTLTATPAGFAATPASTGTTAATANPPPTSQPPPTAAVDTTPPLAANTPTPVAPTPTPIPQPASHDSQATAPLRFLIRLQNDLDDPSGYCIDVRGFGAGIRLDTDLQAHSCKSSVADDQAFVLRGGSQKNSIVLVDYDVCLAVADPEPGASILLAPCDDAAVSQRFQWLGDGRLRLLAEQDASRPELCVGVAGGAGEPAGGRNHLRRDLLLRDCNEAESRLITWRVAEP